MSLASVRIEILVYNARNFFFGGGAVFLFFLFLPDTQEQIGSGSLWLSCSKMILTSDTWIIAI